MVNVVANRNACLITTTASLMAYRPTHPKQNLKSTRTNFPQHVAIFLYQFTFLRLLSGETRLYMLMSDRPVNSVCSALKMCSKSTYLERGLN